MKRSLLISVAALAVACGSSDDTGNGLDGGPSGVGGSPAAGGSQATGGAINGTGATGNPGTGGSTPGTGGNVGSTGGGVGTTGGDGNTGGTLGTGGAGGAPGGTGGTGGTVAVDTSPDVLERNKHPNRDGNFLQPTLTLAAAGKMAKDAAFTAAFTGNMWASPLYLEKGPGGKGVFFAVTTGNDVLALDETTGATVWKKNLGPSPTKSYTNGCGSIHPIGIIGTPVIDAAAGTIYVANATGGDTIADHQVHALSITDGAERAGYPVTVKPAGFSPGPQNQRSALSLVNGVLYVAYGGHVGDCGPYHGWVVGINAADPTKTGGWATLGQGEGIWAAGGLASDGNGVFAITGNSTVGASDHMKSDSEEVVRITGLGVLDRANKNLYFPASWRTMDGLDADFGASNPIYLNIPGSTPANFVVAIAKDGHFYLLDPANLGGMGGHKVDFTVASGSMSIHTVPAAYTTSKGVHVALTTDSGGACPMGGPSGKVVMSVLLKPGSPPVPVVEWCAALGGAVTAPIATTTDGTTNAVVWYMNGGKLVGLDGDTGKPVVTSTDTCNGVRQWTSPIAVKGRIVTGADGHLCSWSPH